MPEHSAGVGVLPVLNTNVFCNYQSDPTKETQ